MARRPRGSGVSYGGHPAPRPRRRRRHRSRRTHYPWLWAYCQPQVVQVETFHYDLGDLDVTTQANYDTVSKEEAIFAPAKVCRPNQTMCRQMTPGEKHQLWLKRQLRKLRG
jgi:hypothetical protein